MYGGIEQEAYTIVREFQKRFYRVARLLFRLHLWSGTQIVETYKALDSAQVLYLESKSGGKAGVSFEEVALIKECSPNRFDVHPNQET